MKLLILAVLSAVSAKPQDFTDVKMDSNMGNFLGVNQLGYYEDTAFDQMIDNLELGFLEDVFWEIDMIMPDEIFYYDNEKQGYIFNLKEFGFYLEFTPAAIKIKVPYFKHESKHKMIHKPENSVSIFRFNSDTNSKFEKMKATNKINLKMFDADEEGLIKFAMDGKTKMKRSWNDNWQNEEIKRKDMVNHDYKMVFDTNHGAVTSLKINQVSLGRHSQESSNYTSSNGYKIDYQVRYPEQSQNSYYFTFPTSQIVKIHDYHKYNSTYKWIDTSYNYNYETQQYEESSETHYSNYSDIYTDNYQHQIDFDIDVDKFLDREYDEGMEEFKFVVDFSAAVNSSYSKPMTYDGTLTILFGNKNGFLEFLEDIFVYNNFDYVLNGNSDFSVGVSLEWQSQCDPDDEYCRLYPGEYMFPYNYIYQEGHIQEKIDWTFQNLQNWSLSRNDTTIFEIETSDRFSIPFRRKRSDFLDDILPVPTYYEILTDSSWEKFAESSVTKIKLIDYETFPPEDNARVLNTMIEINWSKMMDFTQKLSQSLNLELYLMNDLEYIVSRIWSQIFIEIYSYLERNLEEPENNFNSVNYEDFGPSDSHNALLLDLYTKLLMNAEILFSVYEKSSIFEMEFVRNFTCNYGPDYLKFMGVELTENLWDLLFYRGPESLFYSRYGSNSESNQACRSMFEPEFYMIQYAKEAGLEIYAAVKQYVTTFISIFSKSVASADMFQPHMEKIVEFFLQAYNYERCQMQGPGDLIKNCPDGYPNLSFRNEDEDF